MIDFNTFELNRLSKLLWSLKDYTSNNLRFPKAGELVEIAYDVYSKGQLKRVNLPGVDLIGEDGHTYESKVTQFKNKSQMAVRDVILKNSRASSSVNKNLADFFIFTDIKLGKACCVPSSLIYNIKFTGAVLTGHCNPESEHFFLENYAEKYETDYFAEAEKFDYAYVESF
jgi:regulation of enolase protein 1 (concanavalin A-like superfamily)